MVITAVSPFYNPYDVSRFAISQPRNQQTEQQVASNQNTQAQERVVQGEVISRERIQQENTSSTRDTLSQRQFSQEQSNQNQFRQDQSNYSYNAKQAINRYIDQQQQGDQIDQRNNTDESLIDVYV